MLGLISPTIVNSIKQHYVRQEFLAAAKQELMELQLQLCITGWILAQRFGEIDRDYLNQAKLILEKYDGGEEIEKILDFINLLLDSSDEEIEVLVAPQRLEDGVGVSVKNHSTILIDSNAVQISQLPIELQSKIYEFKNVLNIYNQTVLLAKNNLVLTYDSTLSDINHQRLSTGLTAMYVDLQKISTRACEKIQGILDYDL